MSNKSRLKPNRASRPCLKALQDKWILQGEKVGLRHILRPDGTVKYVGYDRGYPWDNRHMSNFYPAVARADRVVITYNGQRAELTAALGRKGWNGHVLDVGTHFPRNDFATDLLAGAKHPVYAGCVAYGDAVLVTDNRMHWVFRPSNMSAEDVEMLHGMLFTPRDLIKEGNRTAIFFHEEPCQSDVVTLKMRCT